MLPNKKKRKEKRKRKEEEKEKKRRRKARASAWLCTPCYLGSRNSKLLFMPCTFRNYDSYYFTLCMFAVFNGLMCQVGFGWLVSLSFFGDLSVTCNLVWLALSQHSLKQKWVWAKAYRLSEVTLGLLAGAPTSAHMVEAGVGHNRDSWCCVHILLSELVALFLSARAFGIVVSSNDPHLRCLRVLDKKLV